MASLNNCLEALTRYRSTNYNTKHTGSDKNHSEHTARVWLTGRCECNVRVWSAPQTKKFEISEKCFRIGRLNARVCRQ